MSIEGRIAIDVSFADSATSNGVQSLKKISLTDTTSYTTGKVAIVTGTCGTAAVSITVNPTSYKNASGTEVTFASVSRLAFAGSPQALLDLENYATSEVIPSSITLSSSDDIPFVIEKSLPVNVYTTAGTAFYTLVIYGS